MCFLLFVHFFGLLSAPRFLSDLGQLTSRKPVAFVVSYLENLQGRLLDNTMISVWRRIHLVKEAAYVDLGLHPPFWKRASSRTVYFHGFLLELIALAYVTFLALKQQVWTIVTLVTRLCFCFCFCFSRSVNQLRYLNIMMKLHSRLTSIFLSLRSRYFQGVRKIRSRGRGWGERRKRLQSIPDILPNAPKHAALPWGANCHMRTNDN